MDSNQVIKVINDHFKDNDEVLEVAMYALSVLTVNDAVLSGIMAKKTEIEGVPPEAVHLMQRFDSGLTLNKFYLENFAPIKMQLTLDMIKLNTLRNYIIVGEKHNDLKCFKQAIAILLSRIDVLTVIAFLYKGIEFAEKFDSQFRLAVQLTSEHEEYFKNKGVM